jgi:hypothetical protein
MRRSRLATAASLLAALAALALLPGRGLTQGAPRGQSGRPGDAPPGMGPAADLDPVGSILEWRDSLQLSESQVGALVRLNLWLFRRNRRLQMRIDSLVPPGADGPWAWGPREPVSPREQEGPDSALAPRTRRDSILARIRPLAEAMRENARIARDSALSILTEAQRERIRQLDSLTTGPRGRTGRRPRS